MRQRCFPQLGTTASLRSQAHVARSTHFTPVAEMQSSEPNMPEPQIPSERDKDTQTPTENTCSTRNAGNNTAAYTRAPAWRCIKCVSFHRAYGHPQDALKPSPISWLKPHMSLRRQLGLRLRDGFRDGIPGPAWRYLGSGDTLSLNTF